MSAALSLPYATPEEEVISMAKVYGQIVVIEGRPIEASLPLEDDTQAGRSALRYEIFLATGWTVVFESRWESPRQLVTYALRALKHSSEVSK